MDRQPTTPQTDETVLDLAAADATDTTRTTVTSAPPRAHHTRRTRRVAAGAVIGSLVIGAVAAVALGGSGSTTATAAGPGGSRGVVAGAPTVTTLAPADPQAEAPEAQPQEQPQPQPHPEPQPPPGIRAVSTNTIHLPAGVFDGSFTVRNDGGSPVDWTWKPGDFGISVSTEGGTLQPGEEVVVTFTINPFQQPVGEFLFANCIYNDDVAKDVWIHGEKKPFVVNPDIPQPGFDLTSKL
jgi:hypothetical protein